MKKIIPAAVSIAALGGAVYLFGLNIDTLRQLVTEPIVLGTAALALISQVFLNGARWRAVLGMLGNEVSLPRAILVYAAGVISNAVFLNVISGLVLRSAMHTSDSISVKASLVAGVAEKLIVLSVLAVMGAVTGGIALMIADLADFVWIAFALSGLAAVAGLALRFTPIGKWIPTDVSRALANRGALIFAGATTVTGTCLAGLAFYILAVGASLDLNWLHLVVIFPIALLLGNLPISIGGWGIREGAFAAGLGLFSYSPDAVLTISITHALMAHLASGIIYISLYATARG